MKKGFTLSEVLITLTVIGIISLMVLPNLITNYENKSYVAQLLTAYNLISNASNQLLTKERVNNLANTSLSDDPKEFLTKYFNITKDCGNSPTNCFNASYRSLDGSKTENMTVTDGSYCVTIATGAAICMSKMTYDTDSAKGYSTIIIDVNGLEHPNMGGRDLFGFNLYTDGQIGSTYDDFENQAAKCTNSSNMQESAKNGLGCFEKLMLNGWKMDY